MANIGSKKFEEARKRAPNADWAVFDSSEKANEYTKCHRQNYEAFVLKGGLPPPVPKAESAAKQPSKPKPPEAQPSKSKPEAKPLLVESKSKKAQQKKKQLERVQISKEAQDNENRPGPPSSYMSQSVQTVNRVSPRSEPPFRDFLMGCLQLHEI